MPNPRGQTTMGDLIEFGAELYLGCGRCMRHRQLPAVEAIQLFGGDRSVEDVRAVAKCERCGGRKYSLTVEVVIPPRGRHKP